jgi:GNAT superfamily N-acetyltransferase
MAVTIRLFEPRDFARVHEICVAAFAEIHEGFAEALGADIFANQYDGWQARYADDLRRLTSDPATEVHVAECDRLVAGFVALTVDREKKFGELGLNAVDPAYQGRGFGKEIYRFALTNLKKRGAEIAYVGTGADAAHAPARAAYEAIGFNKSIPGVHYFRKL